MRDCPELTNVSCSEKTNSGLEGKNIVIFLWSLELGGAERQAILLARHLKHRAGANVRVLAFNTPGLAAKLCDEYGVPWQLLNLRKPLDINSSLSVIKTTFEVIKTLKQLRTDVLVSYLTPPNVIASFAWRWAGVKAFIWNQRSSGCERMPPYDGIAAKYFAGELISNSTLGATFLRDGLGAQRDKIRVIYNGIELAAPKENRAAWRKKLLIEENDFVACMVANLHEGKDHETLLRSWSVVVEKLKSANVNAVLLLAGKCLSTYGTLCALAKDLGIENNLQFLGQVEDIPGLLSAVDLSILSSQSEGLPNAVLESMASGLAVVGTNIPGIQEAVGPEGAPYLAGIADKDELAEKIITLALNASLRAGLEKSSRKRIESFFTTEQMCSSTEQYISELLQRAKS